MRNRIAQSIPDGPVLRFFGLAALFCVPIIGLVPARTTMTVLVIGVGLAGLAYLLFLGQGLDKLVPYDPDGRLAQVALAALLIPVGLAMAALAIGVTFAHSRPPVEAACLCTRGDGLYATAILAMGTTIDAFVLSWSLLAALIGVALVRAHLST